MSLERLVKFESTNIQGKMTAIPLKVAQEAGKVAISDLTGTLRSSSLRRAFSITFGRISADPRQGWLLRIIRKPSEKESSQSDMYFLSYAHLKSNTSPSRNELKAKKKTVYTEMGTTHEGGFLRRTERKNVPKMEGFGHFARSRKIEI